MQAEIGKLEAQLYTFKKYIADQLVEDATDQLEIITKSLKDVFCQPHDITESDKERLENINQQLIELCQQLQVKRDSSKDNLSNVMKNKKKVELYNQLK
ncbi:hypothetical protein I6F53_16400 [Pseudoalteromonas sp. SWN29]|uniref:hypothetical protein n=1 Tax=Pseudoalteromonas sp. SWN29 TaxID=2792064 RepID=UPI0018CE1DF8|nr:hypothetical protein [Pseudoalteromonas sp. SWN29]MBH0028555.1 hypothetical protein [Pseudoalteromonas sp. SWN29]